LLDRFGLAVQLENCFDPAVRREIVKARLAFDADPAAFREQHAQAQEGLAGRIRAARAVLGQLELNDAVHARVSELCIAAQVDGLRADLVMLRAARALAALEAAQAVTVEHVERVAQAVLMHRRKEGGAASGRAGQASSPPPPPSQADDEHGYLPPEPVETTTVKTLRPLGAKKS
jgi:magnesium chelatase subunit I